MNNNYRKFNTDIEHKELTKAIFCYNKHITDSKEMQKQIWLLWKFNSKVCVPTFPEHQPPYDIAIAPTSSGGAYVFYTESNLICQGDIPFIKNIPFKTLLDKIYNSKGIVNGIFINPTIDGKMSPYTIGFTKEFLKELCKGDILAY